MTECNQDSFEFEELFSRQVVARFYVLLQALRRLGLRGTELAHAQASTLRLKLLKIGAQIRVSSQRELCQKFVSAPPRKALAVVSSRALLPSSPVAPD